MGDGQSRFLTFRPNRNEEDVAGWIEHHRKEGDLRDAVVAAVRFYMQHKEPTLARSPISLADLQQAMPELARLLATHLTAPQLHTTPGPTEPSAARQARNKFRLSSGLDDEDDDD